MQPVLLPQIVLNQAPSPPRYYVDRIQTQELLNWVLSSNPNHQVAALCSMQGMRGMTKTNSLPFIARAIQNAIKWWS